MKQIVIIIFTTLTISLVNEIVCEDNSTVLEENLPIVNSTDDGREGKQDSFGELVGGIIGSIAGAVSKTVVDGVLGNSVMNTREFCSPYGSRRSNRYCDSYCDDYYRGPVRGYCQSGLGLCVCECDSIECERYCRRYWDDYDYRSPYDRNRLRDRPNNRNGGFCTNSGCRCD